MVNPFSLLRKPEWEHRDASRRAAAVASAEAAELRAKLPELARNDPEPRVRLAALRRLDDLDLLRERMREDADATVQAMARQRFQQRLLDPAVTQAVRLQAVASAPDPDTLLLLAEQAPEAAVRRAALERLDRPGLVVERCSRDPDPELRLWLLQRIDDIATLERIAERVRRTDKMLNRSARERVQALRLAARDPVALRERALAICEELDELRRRAAADAADQRDQLEQEWRELAPGLDEAMARRVTGYFEALDAALAGPPEPSPELPLVEPPECAEASAPPEPVREPDTALVALVTELEARAPRLDARALDDLEKRWLARLRQVEPLLPEEHALEVRFRKRAEDLRQGFRQQARAREQAREGLEERVTALEAALESGQVGPARELQRQLDANRQVLGQQFPRGLGRRLGRAGRELERLEQWQRWSDNKVRLSLIAELEQLAGSGLHPDAVAARLKQLQARWQQLDEVEERPGGGAVHPLTGRFHAAARRVMAPARPYFEKRSELREARGEALAAFVVEAASRLDQPLVARDLIALRRQVIDRLRQTDALDPGARRDLSRQLRGLLDRIKQAIGLVEAEAEAGKRKLLANLRRDLMHAELTTALPLAREAQSAWKGLPRAARAVDDALWKELRELVDPWFAQANSRQRERQAAEAAASDAARAILDELEQLAAADAATLAQADARVAALRSRWLALAGSVDRGTADPRPEPGARPRRGARPPARAGLDERAFDRALARIDAARARQARLDRQAELVRLVEAGALCDQLEASGSARETSERARVLAQLDGLGLPLAIRSALDARINHSQTDPGQSERAEALTVLAELAAGAESPESARELRRRLQIERLSAHLSGDGLDQDMHGLLGEFVSLAGLSPTLRAALAERWRVALKAVLEAPA